ncbi:hypothetical protein FGO68_gene12340 [Halteria grandinella]|uniref:Uncharacterized protein n=1 Tax=Halteria grandinella TaxID=5974 RepID=A0A8J8NED8_HALGN|nr:hypothetical protein FGO68_gene12340 [Halteria grandinella]
MALIFLSLALPLISSLPTSLSDTLTKCPRITCSEPLGDDVCFLHSSDNPVSWIKLQSCPPGKLCPSPLASFTTHSQSILAANDPLKSPTFQRLTKATCETTYNRNLLPGRKCTSNFQCQSFVCEEQKCKGYSSGASCYKHEQCDIGLACISKGAFPYATTCDSLRKIGDQCEEDVECQQTSVCWYQTRGDFYQSKKSCIVKYGLSDNQTFGWAPKHYETYQDVLYNGRLCQSGFAVPYYDSNDTRPLGLCTTFTNVYTDQGNFTMNQAAQCMVSNLASYCQYHYTTPTGIENVVKIRCACPADGSIGYCPLPSIEAMRKYSLYDYALSGNGTNCHTLDRNSELAQSDCGIGLTSSLLESYLNAKVLIEQWPLAQNERVRKCLEDKRPESYKGIVLASVAGSEAQWILVRMVISVVIISALLI